MRLIGLGLLLLGSIGLALGVSTIFSLQWLGLPLTTNLARTLVFALVGMIFGTLGYRLACGTWRGSWQVPHRAAALGALVFFGYAAKAMLLKTTRPHFPPLWILSTAGLALVSWCVAACRRRSWR